MAEKYNKNGLLHASFEPDNSDSFAFTISLQAEELKKKKCFIHICFADTLTSAPLTIDNSTKFSRFTNEKGEICLIIPVKREVFSGRGMRVNVPYDIFPRLLAGDRVTATVSLEEKEGSAHTASKSFDLMVNLGKKFTLYTLEKQIRYVKSTGAEEEKLAFAQQLLDEKDLDDEAFTALLELLTDLAENHNVVAQFELFNIHKNDKRGVFDAAAAVEWLKKAAESEYPPAVKELTNAGKVEQLERTGLKNSLELYQKAAENGDADAQYTMYEYLSKQGEYFDEKQAVEWLKKAAAGGNDAAVKQLYGHYKDAFVSQSTVNKYLAILEQAAQNGSAHAQLALFEAYFFGNCMGRNVRVDKKFAAECLLCAADNGCAEACYRIWSLYIGGNDMLMDEETAVGWLKKAADGMVPAALNALGDLYILGECVEKNNDKGMECIRKAAELQDPDAQMRVLAMHRDGRYRDVLVEQDMDKALDYLMGYAKGGNPLAQLTLWVLYQEGNDLLLTRQEAIDWLNKSAQQQYDPAVYELAKVYLTGEYTDIDTQKGFVLLEQAAKRGETRAQFALYQLYFTGEYFALKTDINKERSYKWLALAAGSYHLAQYQMWQLYRTGNEISLDSDEALQYLFESVKNQSPAGMYELGSLYIEGEMVPKNVHKGIGFLEQSKKLRYPKAIYAISRMKAQGECGGETVEKDEAEALRLLKLSAELGYAPACYEIWEHFSRTEGFPIEETWAKKLLESAASQGYQPAVKALKSPDDAG